MDDLLPAHGASVVLLDPAIDTVDVEDVLVVAVEFGHHLAIILVEVLHADAALIDIFLRVIRIECPGFLADKILNDGYPREVLLLLLELAASSASEHADHEAAEAHAAECKDYEDVQSEPQHPESDAPDRGQVFRSLSEHDVLLSVDNGSSPKFENHGSHEEKELLHDFNLIILNGKVSASIVLHWDH